MVIYGFVGDYGFEYFKNRSAAIKDAKAHAKTLDVKPPPGWKKLKVTIYEFVLGQPSPELILDILNEKGFVKARTEIAFCEAGTGKLVKCKRPLSRPTASQSSSQPEAS